MIDLLLMSKRDLARDRRYLKAQLLAADIQCNALQKDLAMWQELARCHDPQEHRSLAHRLHIAQAELEVLRGEDPHQASLRPVRIEREDGGALLLVVVVALLVAGAVLLGAQLVQRIDDRSLAVEAAAEHMRPVANEETTTTTTTLPPTTTSAPPVRRTKSGARYPTDELLHRLAMCETGGKMDNPNTGNGYFGYFQFDAGTWWSVGGEGYPHQHPYEVQRDLARTLILQAGWGRFPACSRVIGAR